MANKIQIRRDTTTNWTTVDPILSQGELGLDTTLHKIKIGDGESLWTALDFFVGETGPQGPAGPAGTSGSATQLINGSATVSLGANGIIHLPHQSTIEDVAITMQVGTILTFNSDYQSNVNVNGNGLWLNNDSTSQQVQAGWVITFADGTTRTANTNTTVDTQTGAYVVGFDTNLVLSPAFPVTIQSPNYAAAAAGKVALSVNEYNWNFDTDGNLSLPGNIVAGIGNPSHFVVDAGQYWTSIQWKNFTSPQDPSVSPFECQSQLLRVFSGTNNVNGHSELVAVSVVRPSSTNYNGLMFSTSDSQIPDAPYNDGTGTRHDWILGGNGKMTFPTLGTNARTGTAETLAFSNTNSQKAITTAAGTAIAPTVERLVIAGGDGYGTGEGGDIYLWAGTSGTDGGSGGDIKVDAGNGQNGSEGGTIKIRGGNSLQGSITSNGGFIEMFAGNSYNTTGGDGGFIDILAGNSVAGVGGSIALTAGQSGNSNLNGEVRLNTVGGSLVLKADGKITLPNTSILQSNTSTLLSIGANVDLVVLENAYINALSILTETFSTNSAEPGYPWTIALPLSYLSYDEIISELSPNTIPSQTVITTQAQVAKTAYLDWQLALTTTKATIGVTDKLWIFNASGNLTLPGKIQGVLNEDIYISTSGTIMTSPPGPGTFNYVFGSTGTLTVPSEIHSPVLTIRSTSGTLHLEATDTIHIGSGIQPIDIQIGSAGSGTRTLLGSDRVQILATVPTTSKGINGDFRGMVAFSSNYMYYCTAAYDGTNDIWKRVALSADTW